MSKRRKVSDKIEVTRPSPSQEEEGPISSLPFDVIVHILRLAKIVTRLRAQLVSVKFYSACWSCSSSIDDGARLEVLFPSPLRSVSGGIPSLLTSIRSLSLNVGNYSNDMLKRTLELFTNLRQLTLFADSAVLPPNITDLEAATSVTNLTIWAQQATDLSKLDQMTWLDSIDVYCSAPVQLPRHTKELRASDISHQCCINTLESVKNIHIDARRQRALTYFDAALASKVKSLHLSSSTAIQLTQYFTALTSLEELYVPHFHEFLISSPTVLKLRKLALTIGSPNQLRGFAIMGQVLLGSLRDLEINLGSEETECKPIEPQAVYALLGTLTNLERLVIWKSMISELDCLTNLSSLDSLALRDTIRIPLSLGNIPRLERIKSLEFGGSAPANKLDVPRVGSVVSKMFPMLRSLYLHDDGLYYESWDIQQLSGLRALTTLEELKLGLPVPIVQREFDTLRGELHWSLRKLDLTEATLPTWQRFGRGNIPSAKELSQKWVDAVSHLTRLELISLPSKTQMQTKSNALVEYSFMGLRKLALRHDILIARDLREDAPKEKLIQIL